MTSSGWTRQHRCEYRQTTVQEPWGATCRRKRQPHRPPARPWPEQAVRRLTEYLRRVERREIRSRVVELALKRRPGGVGDEGRQPQEHHERLNPPRIRPCRLSPPANRRGNLNLFHRVLLRQSGPSHAHAGFGLRCVAIPMKLSTDRSSRWAPLLAVGTAQRLSLLRQTRNRRSPGSPPRLTPAGYRERRYLRPAGLRRFRPLRRARSSLKPSSPSTSSGCPGDSSRL